MTVVTIVQQILTGPLGQATLRFYAPSVDSATTPSFFATVSKLQLLVSLLVIGAGVPLALCIKASSHLSHLALILAALAIAVVTGANGTLDAVQTAARHRSVVALHQAATQWSRPLLAWLLVAYVSKSSTAALVGYLLASCGVFLSQVYQLRRRFPAAFSKSHSSSPTYLRQFLVYSWPISTWGIFAAVQLSSDRWILSLSLDNRSVGIYTAASQLGFAPIMLLATAASVFISPVLFSRVGDGSDPERLRAALKLNWQLVGLTATISVIVAMCTYLLRVQVVRLLCGPEYAEVNDYLPGLVLAGGLFACGQIATHALLIHRNTKGLIAPKIVTGILACILYVFGARFDGIHGVVIANIVWTLIYFLWVTMLARSASAKVQIDDAEAA
jgi:O-antigen/teichoic acid export membrane protein